MNALIRELADRLHDSSLIAQDLHRSDLPTSEQAAINALRHHLDQAMASASALENAATR
jgi:hypothetical protein